MQRKQHDISYDGISRAVDQYKDSLLKRIGKAAEWQYMQEGA